jgi:transmembrane sensor
MSALTPESVDDLDRIECEASEWLVRAEEGGLDPDGQRDFNAWLAQDQRHRKAYEDVRRAWDDIAGLDHLGSRVPLMPEPAEHVRSVPAWKWPRVAMGGLAAAAAVMLGLITVPSELWKPAPHYQTELAETRIVTLPDGSSVTLGARSSIKIRFSEHERRVLLTGGEAFFDVVHNSARPFLVEAGNSVITDIGTKFDVNLSRGTVRVSVLEGLVTVARANEHESVKPRLLKAGERTEVAIVEAAPDVAGPTPAPIVVVHAQAPGAWREGRLVFDNVRLADLADDVNRYYAPGVRVADDVGDVRVTASFKTSEIPAFMSTVSESFPVSAVRGDGGSFEVRAKPR